MQDRIPQFPGRVTLTPVEGQPNTYDMVRADQPTQTGTPLSKANLLKDLTAAQFGLDSTAVPDDVLSWIGKYNEHWWSLLHGVDQSYYKQNETKNTSIVNMADTSKGSVICYWSRTLSFDKKTGSIGLSGTIASIQFNTTTNARIVAGLQQLVDISAESDFYMYTEDNQTIYHIPQNATCPSSGGPYTAGYTFGCSSTNPVYGTENSASAISTELIQVPTGETTYEHSTDRNAYPDSGTVDGIVYTYLGCPFEKMPRIANIMTGVYTGTGVGGSTSPNIINTPFAAKMIFIKNSSATIGATSVLATDTYPTGVYYGSIRSNDGSSYQTSYNTFTFSSNYVSWYLSSSSMSLSYFTTEGKATAQLNTANTTYMYIIIG